MLTKGLFVFSLLGGVFLFFRYSEGLLNKKQHCYIPLHPIKAQSKAIGRNWFAPRPTATPPRIEQNTYFVQFITAISARFGPFSVLLPVLPTAQGFVSPSCRSVLSLRLLSVRLANTVCLSAAVCSQPPGYNRTKHTLPGVRHIAQLYVCVRVVFVYIFTVSRLNL